MFAYIVGRMWLPKPSQTFHIFFAFFNKKHDNLVPQTTIKNKWLFQLDDAPNLYIENGSFTISIH